jgi:hypothetical protein
METPPVKLASIAFFKINQAVLNEIKNILTIKDDVLREQKFFWYNTPSPIEDLSQQNEIKVALESHYRTPTVWLSSTKIQINIDPDERILTKK